jgi:integrase
MAARPGKRRTSVRGEKREAPERVTFNDDDFEAFLDALYRRYPYQWIALAMGETDPETGLTHGEILAHDVDHVRVADVAVAHRRAHPAIDVRFFTTAMGRI